MSIKSIIFGTFKIVLITFVAVFCLYNAASFFGLIPEKFSAVQLFKENYISLKAVVTRASPPDDMIGNSAKYILAKMNGIEKYYKDSELYEAEQASIAEKCNENKGYRTMMLIGESEETKKGCVGKGDPITRAKEAVSDMEKKQQEQIDMLNAL